MRVVSAVWAFPNRFPPVVVDTAIALFVVAINALTLAEDGGYPADRPLGWSTYLLTVAVAAPLILRRRWPVGVALTSTALAMVYQVVESPSALEGSESVPLMVALYTVSAYEPRRRGLILAVLAVAALIVSVDGTPFSGEAVWVVASLAIGAVVRGRRETALLAEQRRVEYARRMVDEERMRIARELHDVVAHSIATINVQAGMAAHVFDAQPEEARAALREIRQVSKDALRDLRATLGLLRSATDREDERTPAPHLDQLDGLLARAEAAGVRVALTTSGTPRALPTAVDLTAYRIVQEALTNVVRHAGPQARATVSIAYRPGEIALLVVDGGPPTGKPPPGSGGAQLGLIGMRERIATIGGELAAGPRQGGGFEVRASLPTGER